MTAMTAMTAKTTLDVKRRMTNKNYISNLACEAVRPLVVLFELARRCASHDSRLVFVTIM